MTVRLTLILSGQTLKRHEFEEFTRVRVGRSPDCEVHIDNLGVSRYHCEVVRKEGILQLRDLRSNNGTFVNGVRVETHNLNGGDTISLGKFLLRFETDEASAVEKPLVNPAAGDGMMTMQIDPAALARKQREQLSRNKGHLVLHTGEEVNLERPLFTFGGEESTDLQLGGWFCPRLVAVLVKDETGFRLLDVSPRGNAITVNGIPKRDSWLNDNDRVTVRKQTFTFRRGAPVGRA